MYIPQDEQAAALYDFFVYSQIFGHAEGKAERNAQAADQKDAEREREKPFSSAAGDKQGRE